MFPHGDLEISFIEGLRRSEDSLEPIDGEERGFHVRTIGHSCHRGVRVRVVERREGNSGVVELGAGIWCTYKIHEEREMV